MGKSSFSTSQHQAAGQKATAGGTRSATHQAEERVRQGKGLDPLVDPKGLPHLGPIRRSLPRFEQQADGAWLMTKGVAMLEETLLDTTGSMRNNVEIAFEVLPASYDLLTAGDTPVLGRYDLQIINACFGDVEDQGTPVLCRSQAEMDNKITQQLTMLVPSKDGCGNGKEDPQFGLFGAAYLTAASINRYGLQYYHFTVSDEPIVETIDYKWLQRIFGDKVLESVRENGYEMSSSRLPATETVVKDLQQKAHAFFLQVASRADVKDQWTRYYGKDHVVMLPEGTTYLHYVKACIIGLTEGVLNLESMQEFLEQKGVGKDHARQIVRAVAHIPIGAQTLCPNFKKLPKAGDRFREKTDLWPIDPKKVGAAGVVPPAKPAGGPKWL